MRQPSTDIADADTPESLPAILRRAADKLAESPGDLSAAWQDANAGKVWGDFARILNRAADSCDRAITRRLG